MSITISPKSVALEEFDDDAEEEEGKPSSTDCTNARKASAVKVSLGDHVRKVEHRSV
jgi:hypothetical protein